jgi:hypothetical protein
MEVIMRCIFESLLIARFPNEIAKQWGLHGVHDSAGIERREGSVATPHNDALVAKIGHMAVFAANPCATPDDTADAGVDNTTIRLTSPVSQRKEKTDPTSVFNPHYDWTERSGSAIHFKTACLGINSTASPELGNRITHAMTSVNTCLV